MSHPSLRALNLNLLPVLQSLLTTHNVTRTAEQLHMSQSAVSEALGKLRIQFRDELLVRSGREMKPTPLALSLQAQLDQSMEALETLIQRDEFDPATLARRFVVATADTVMLAVVNPLIDRLQAAAPGVSVQFVDIQSNDQLPLTTGELDLMIVPQGVVNTGDLFEMPLYDETFVCIARREHPVVGRGKLKRAAYDALDHVAYRADQRMDRTLETTLVGPDQNDIVRLPSFSLLPALVEQSDAVALIQKRAAEHYAGRYDIQVFDAPFPVPTVSISGFWARIHDRDPAHRWFRDQVRSATGAM